MARRREKIKAADPGLLLYGIKAKPRKKNGLLHSRTHAVSDVGSTTIILFDCNFSRSALVGRQNANKLCTCEQTRRRMGTRITVWVYLTYYKYIGRQGNRLWGKSLKAHGFRERVCDFMCVWHWIHVEGVNIYMYTMRFSHIMYELDFFFVFNICAWFKTLK